MAIHAILTSMLQSSHVSSGARQAAPVGPAGGELKVFPEALLALAQPLLVHAPVADLAVEEARDEQLPPRVLVPPHLGDLRLQARNGTLSGLLRPCCRLAPCA